MMFSIVFADAAARSSDAVTWADVASVAIALAALLVGLASIKFTRDALQTQRTHNQLSVRPIPYLRKIRYRTELAIQLENHGVGPLLINSLTMKVNGQQYADILQILTQIDDKFIYTFTTDFSGRVINAGEKLTLFEVSSKDSAFEAERERIKGLLKDVSLSLNFTSIYREKFPEFSDNLEWFGR